MRIIVVCLRFLWYILDRQKAPARKDGDFLRRLRYFALLTLLCCAMLCILLEQVNVMTLALGLLGGAGVVFITHRVILDSDNISHEGVPLLHMVHFFLYLIYAVFKAGISLFPVIISGKGKVGVYVIKTRIKGNLMRAILANAITMTPGTVTLDAVDDTLTVLWLRDERESDAHPTERMIGRYERIILGRSKRT